MNKLDIQKNGKPCIYKIINKINNKLYIGSAIGHYRRKGQHYWLLRNNKHWNNHLQSAYNKYGEENINFEVLEFINDLSILASKEEYWIKKLNTTDRTIGYNIRIECQTNLGKKWPIESRIKFSLSKKGKRIPHINYEQLNKLTMKKIEGVHKVTNTKVTFNSLKEAGETLHIDRTCISKALNGKIKSAGNYYWNFVEQSTLKNSVNSGNIHLDNPEPSLVNDIIVTKKVQRLMSEESTNNLNTSAEQPIHLSNFSIVDNKLTKIY